MENCAMRIRVGSYLGVCCRVLLLHGLRWVEANQVRVGDVLVGWKDRRLVPVEVLGKSEQTCSGLLIAFQHTLLVVGDGTKVRSHGWRRRVSRVDVCVPPPQSTDETWEAGWLAGMLDGEATLSLCGRAMKCFLYQKDEQRLQQALNFLRKMELDGKIYRESGTRTKVLLVRGGSGCQVSLVSRVRAGRLIAKAQQLIARGVPTSCHPTPATWRKVWAYMTELEVDTPILVEGVPVIGG